MPGTRNGEVTLNWGGLENRLFRIGIKQAIALEEKTGIGVFEIYWRLTPHRAHVRDLREIIRLGLTGAGDPDDKAWELIYRYFDLTAPGTHLNTAQKILEAYLLPPEDNELPKAAAVQPDGSEPKTDAPTGPRSSAPAP